LHPKTTISAGKKITRGVITLHVLFSKIGVEVVVSYNAHFKPISAIMMQNIVNK
jgi:hypothetical protein